ncbi:transcription factor grauzone-like isoform X2 [Wyeomyia smithii]|nr:transcription factor grauzone-like isoform X2 [Wyeomyia smithii]
MESNGTSIKDVELSVKLNVVFNFEFTNCDVLPQSVCVECLSKVSDYYNFHEMVRSNQKQINFSAEIVGSPLLMDIKTDIMVVASAIEDNQNLIHKPYLDLYQDTEKDPDEEAIGFNKSELVDDECDKTPPRTRMRSLKLKNKYNQHKEKVSSNNDEKIRKLDEENKKIREFFTMKCDICLETFVTFDRLQRHTRKQHNSRGSIKCCNRVFYKKCRIIDHINFHLNPGRFHCDICNKNYNDKYYLDLHNQKKHNTEIEKPFKCDKCGQNFVREYLLKAHATTHVQAECVICHKILANASTLRTHILNMHSDDSKHICDSCGQEFRTKLAMERHIKIHLGINPIERIQCHICSKWVNGKPNLKLHIKTVHNEENQAVACDICQQVSPNLRALSSHKRRVHVEEKFECEFCGKKFKRKIYLKEHRASHTGETLYSCNICGMTTNSNANLYSHKKSKHPDEWREAKKKALAAAYG